MEGGAQVSVNGGYPYNIFMFDATQISPFLTLSMPSTLTKKSISIPSLISFAIPHNKTRNYKTSSSKPTPKSPPSSRSARQSALTHIQQSSDLRSALSRFEEILKAQDLNIILRNFGKSNRWKELSQLFEWMQEHGKVNIASYSSYIKFMAEANNTSSALNAYQSINDEIMRNNISICNSVLGCLVKSNSFGKATNLFDQMKRNGLQPDGVTYSTLLAGCMKVENGYRRALKLVEELEQYGIPMDGVIYGALIAVCASKFQYEEAEMFFNRMKSEGHSPNMYHYSSLLNAYSANGNHEKADELVNDMKTAGLVPNKVVLTTLLKVYVRAGLFEKSKALLSQLEALGYAGDEMPYCLLMDGLSKSGEVDDAKLVFQMMNKRRVRSDGYSHSIMISAYCRAGQLKEAKELARNYEAIYNKYDVVILNAMLCAYCRAGDMESVMQTLRKMDKLAVNPDQSTFRILIKYFCKEKLYLLAYRTFQDMCSKGYQAEEEMLSSLILHLGSSGAHSEAVSVYNKLRHSETAMPKSLHEKMLHILISGRLFKDAYDVVKDNAKFISPGAIKRLLTAFMRLGDVNLINDLLETIHITGYNIDQDVFNLAISRYIAQPKTKELLLELLQWMPNRGYVVDSSTRNMILKSSNIYGYQLIAELLSKQHSTSKTLRCH